MGIRPHTEKHIIYHLNDTLRSTLCNTSETVRLAQTDLTVTASARCFMTQRRSCQHGAAVRPQPHSSGLRQATNITDNSLDVPNVRPSNLPPLLLWLHLELQSIKVRKRIRPALPHSRVKEAETACVFCMRQKKLFVLL